MDTGYIDFLMSKKLTLIMSLPENNPEFAKIAFDNGADVVKMHVNLHHHASQHHFSSLEEEQAKLQTILDEATGPCGIVAGSDVEQVRTVYPKLIDMGFSFISLYAHHAPLSLLKRQDVYKMIAFDHTYSLESLPMLELLGADVFEASVMSPETYGQPLSVKELLTYKQLCEKTSLPVVVPTQRAIRMDEVSQLAECGVSGIMIGAVVTGTTAAGIGRIVSDFRKAIDTLG